jgi:hippurate hydrolase
MHIRFSTTLLATAAILSLTAPALALDVAAVKPQIETEVNADYPHLFDIYKDIHQHPELGFQETRTAAKLAGEMRALGFEVTEGVGKTGIVAIYKNGPGPQVMVRTELDALPMQEKTGLPYASQAKALWNGTETYVAHSCGHDSHMAIWVGTAKALLSMKDKWSGTLMFIGQPSEEAVSGAKAMLADGLYKRFGKPDYAFALHVGPDPVGTIGYKAGPFSTTSDFLEITFKGRGAHGSMPEKSIDPIVMAARFVEDVQTVISREKDPAAFGVVTVGSINAGTVGNIIPDEATLRGTIRTLDDGVRAKIVEGVTRTANAVAVMSGAPTPEVKIGDTAYSVINDPALTAKTAAVLKEDMGNKVKEMPRPISGSEDFSEFTRAGVPGVYFGLGGMDPKVIAEDAKKGIPVPVNHSPLFTVMPEPTIKTGVEAMTLTVMNVMPPKG